MAACSLDEIVNTNEYPLNQQDSVAYKNLVERLRGELNTNGIVLLPQFMKKSAIEATIQNIEDSSHIPFKEEVSHNIYLADVQDDEMADEDHPKKFSVRTCKACYTYDQIGLLNPLNSLFMSDEVKDFIRLVLGIESLDRTADALGALTVHKFLDGDELGWHFDHSQFAVTLLLQEPQHGGDFEFYPSLRNDENPNYSKVKEILTLSNDGQDLKEHGVKVANLKAGTLSIFCGHHSLHRVKPVKGDTPRYLTVLSYDQKANYLNDYTKMTFFGRLK